MEQWYLAQYRPGRANLQKVQYLLENRNITSWTPQIFTTKTVGPENREKKVLEPLFPGYIFIEFDVNEHHPSKLSSLPGMADFVKSCGSFNQVPFSVLDELMSYPIGHRDTTWNTDNLIKNGDHYRLHDINTDSTLYVAVGCGDATTCSQEDTDHTSGSLSAGITFTFEYQ